MFLMQDGLSWIKPQATTIWSFFLLKTYLNVTHHRQFTLVYLFGITRLPQTRKRLENHLYIMKFELISNFFIDILNFERIFQFLSFFLLFVNSILLRRLSRFNHCSPIQYYLAKPLLYISTSNWYQPWWLSGWHNSVTFFKDSNPAPTQVLIPLKECINNLMFFSMHYYTHSNFLTIYDVTESVLQSSLNKTVT